MFDNVILINSCAAGDGFKTAEHELNYRKYTFIVSSHFIVREMFNIHNKALLQANPIF